MKTVHIFGCSHSTFFRGYSNSSYCVKLHNIDSLSLSGLVKDKHTTLHMYGRIMETLKNDPCDCLVLKIGQVDMECIYYYKSMVKKEPITIKTFVDHLIGIYSNFLDQIKQCHSGRIIIFGINLPCISTDVALYNYIRYIIGVPNEILIDTSLIKQTSMAALFNQELATLCQQKGHTFVDTTKSFLNQKTGLCDEKFQTSRDHHYKGLNESQNFRESYTIFYKHLDTVLNL
jgi:hypothetical protein